ncbi:MAG: hypothetical protein G01um101413_778 [Parcubacteria group bacterium Gr01-1014_13]|nr:MAG: hypothetical protein G01um101413_778 [Parcubacteria group bacterium Gr01-1014_13]
MGLFVCAYSKMLFVHKKDAKCVDDEGDHIGINSVPTFIERLDGLQEGCYECKGKSKSIFSVMYSYYNDWRELLSYAALKASAQEVWQNPEKYKGKPFFELVNMSDSDGAIGPVTSKKLAGDFEEFSGPIKKSIRKIIKEKRFSFYGDTTVKEEIADWLYIYSQLRKGFALASDNGFVKFS